MVVQCNGVSYDNGMQCNGVPRTGSCRMLMPFCLVLSGLFLFFCEHAATDHSISVLKRRPVRRTARKAAPVRRAARRAVPVPNMAEIAPTKVSQLQFGKHSHRPER